MGRGAQPHCCSCASAREKDTQKDAARGPAHACSESQYALTHRHARQRCAARRPPRRQTRAWGKGPAASHGTMKLLRFSLNPTSNSFKRQPVLLRSRLNFVGCRRLQASAGSRVVRQDRLAVGVEARGIVRTAGLTLSGPCDGSCGQTGDSSAATTSVARAMPRHREGGSGRSGVVAARGFATGARGQAGSGTDDSQLPTFDSSRAFVGTRLASSCAGPVAPQRGPQDSCAPVGGQALAKRHVLRPFTAGPSKGTQPDRAWHE